MSVYACKLVTRQGKTVKRRHPEAGMLPITWYIIDDGRRSIEQIEDILYRRFIQLCGSLDLNPLRHDYKLIG